MKVDVYSSDAQVVLLRRQSDMDEWYSHSTVKLNWDMREVPDELIAAYDKAWKDLERAGEAIEIAYRDASRTNPVHE